MLTLQWVMVLGLAIIFCLLFALALVYALPFYGRWLSRYPSLGCLLALVLVILFGVVGSDFGLANLFWHERIFTQIQAGLGLMFLASILFFFGYLGDSTLVQSGADAASWFGTGLTWASGHRGLAWLGWVCKGCRAFFGWRALPTTTTLAARMCLDVMCLPIVVGLWASAAVSSVPAVERVDPLARLLRLIGLPLGATFGLALVVLPLVWLARSYPGVTWRRRHGWLVVLPFTVTISIVNLIPWTREYLAASMCICLLLSVIALLLFATGDNGLIRLLTIAILIGVAAVTNSSDFKLKYPLLAAYYANPLSIRYDQDVGADREPELLAEGGTDQSVDYFDKFLEMYPRGTTGIIGRSASLASSGRMAEAWDAIDSLIERRGLVTSTSLCTRGIIELERGQFARAFKDFDRAIPMGPKRSIAYFGHGLALMGLTRYEEAAISLEKAVTTDPSSEVARLAFAIALLQSNQGALAKTHLSKVINDTTGRIETIKNDGGRASAGQSPVSDRYIDHIRRAMAYQLDGNLADAGTDLAEAIRLAPARLAPRLVRAGVLLESRDASHALTDLDWVINQKNDHAAFGARLNRGRIYLDQNNAEKALDDFSVAVTLDPGSVDALVDQSFALQKLKLPVEALASINCAIESDPDGIAARKGRAFLYFFAKDFRRALSDLDDVLKVLPKDLEALNNRAGALWQMKETRQAQGALDAALKIDPRSAVTLVNKSIIAFETGHRKEALDLLDKALEFDPESDVARVNRAVARFAGRDDGGALADLDRVLVSDPENVAALVNRATVWIIENKLDKALIDLDAALKLDPANPAARVNRAGVLTTNGETGQALADLNAVLESESANVPALIGRVRVWVIKGDLDRALTDLDAAIRSEPSHVAARMSRAATWMAKGETDKAMADLHVALESQPMNVVALTNRAGVWLTVGEPRKALADLDTALESEPTNVPAQVVRATAWMALGQMDKALTDLNAAIQSEPTNGPARVNRAGLWMTKGDVDKAFADLDAALRSDPTNVFALLDRAVAWTTKGETDKAFADLDAALRFDPTYVLARVNLAGLWMTKGNPDQALVDLDAALQSDPAYAPALVARGSAWMTQNQLDKALVDLNAAVKLEPTNVMALSFRAGLWIRTGETDKALADLDAALKTDPTNVVALSNRAGIWMRKSEPDKALTDLDAVIKLDPTNVPARTIRANSWLAKGNPGKALDDLSRALESEPTSASALAARANLYVREGKLDEALEDANTSLRFRPNDAWMRHERAIFYLMKGELPAAEADLMAAIELDPEKVESHALLGDVFKRRGNDQKSQAETLRAAQLLERSLSGKLPGRKLDVVPWIKLPSRSPTERVGREGVDAADEQRYNSAIEIFTKGIAEARLGDPQAVPALLFNRAMARSLMGQAELAVGDFQAALEQNPALAFVLAKPSVEAVPVKSLAPSPASMMASLRKPGPPSRKTLLAMSTSAVPTFEARSAAVETSKPKYAFVPSPRAMMPGRELLLPKATSRLISDQKALEAWQTHAGGISSGKPKIVVVAVSGGGIVASYWTVLCLTQIESRDHDFPYRIRMFAGASGGMVGAGYYVAQLRAREIHSQAIRSYPAYQRSVLSAIAEDSLTPTVRCLALHDLPAFFCWWDQDWDRGRALEETWEKNTQGVLAQSFASLKPGEEQGWRPSLVVSPTLAEQGRRLLISNLDLRSVEEGTLTSGVQFFKLFPDAEEFKLSTALRMNAAFPYISPAALLPIKRPRLKAIDAGYLENYGVGFLFEWLHRHREWLAENTSGIALIQMRAYSPGLREEYKVGVSTTAAQAKDPEASATALDQVGRGMEGLFTPIRGFATAKQAAMLDDNNSKIDQLVQIFRELRPSRGDKQVEFFKPFVFQCDEEAPLGWSLTANDRERLDRIFKNPNADSENQQELEALLKFLAD